jgi:RNA polymerase sigma factor (sigma-70 family)
MQDVRPLEALAQAAVEGDAAALDALCRALESPIFRVCLRMLGDPRDAEDATQDVLVKVVTNLSRFEGRSALRTWVHQIAVRHVLAMKATRAEAGAVDLEGLAERLEQGLAWGANAPPPSPEDRALEREVRLSCTQGMLLAASREERAALVLVEVLGLDAAEAAEILEVSHAALRQRLSRGRGRLEAFLVSHCGVVSERAACRCASQLPAKRALGLTIDRQRYAPLAEAPLDEPEVVARASAELRQVAQLFRKDLLFAPRSVRQRLSQLLPTLLR